MPLIVLLFMLGQFLTVVPQPVGEWDYVSNDWQTVTQWQSVENVGLLAHSTLAGQYFEGLSAGDNIAVFDSRLEVTNYRVTEVHHYMIDGARLVEGVDNRDGDAVIDSMFTSDLTLQTCIACPAEADGYRDPAHLVCGFMFVLGEAK